MSRPMHATLALLAAIAIPACAGSGGGVEREVEGFDFAVNVAFAPDGTMFVADKDLGQIRVVRDGELLPDPFLELPVLHSTNEAGLLGVAVHPDFPDEPWIYAYFSDARDGVNRLVRIRAEGDSGTDVEVLLDLLPMLGFHNGGDITFGPDGKLYLVTGDGTVPDLAQDPESLGGKVLRLNADGSVPQDNPFGPEDPVFALGIRNSFGLCFDPATGNLWETENGPDSHDEVNLIEPGGNYGWPLQLGPGGGGFVDPVVDFPETVVPAGCAFDSKGEAMLFGGAYTGSGFRVDAGTRETSVVLNLEGGILDVARAPDGSLRFVTPTAIYRSDEVPKDPEGGSSAALTGTGIVVLVALVGGLLLMRARLLRR